MSQNRAKGVVNIHFCQFGNSFLGKRSTPFGHNIEQKDYSLWSQNRAKGVVNIHFCHFGNSFLGKRSTPFGHCSTTDIALVVLETEVFGESSLGV